MKKRSIVIIVIIAIISFTAASLNSLETLRNEIKGGDLKIFQRSMV